MKSKKLEEQVFIVPSATIARKLLKMGFSIIDIKPHRNNRAKTVFIFKDAENIKDAYFRLNDEMKMNNQEQ